MRRLVHDEQPFADLDPEGFVDWYLPAPGPVRALPRRRSVGAASDRRGLRAVGKDDSGGRGAITRGLELPARGLELVSSWVRSSTDPRPTRT